MTGRDYKAIEDIQLRYDTYVQCRRFDHIVNELFSGRGDVAISHSDLPAPVRGREHVRAFFQMVAEKFEENGGFLRTDLSTSQVLESLPDGISAAGTWLTIGVKCEMGAFGKTREPYPMYRVMGQRHAKFVLEDGQWKIHETAWQEICSLGPIEYRPPECSGWSGMRERCWELPPSENSRPWEGRRCR